MQEESLVEKWVSRIDSKSLDCNALSCSLNKNMRYFHFVGISCGSYNHVGASDYRCIIAKLRTAVAISRTIAVDLKVQNQHSIRRPTL